MKKILGYILATVGIILLVIATIPFIREAVNLPASIPPSAITIAALLIIALSIMLIYTKSGNKQPEVPIYEGKNIVGYRRVN